MLLFVLGHFKSHDCTYKHSFEHGSLAYGNFHVRHMGIFQEFRNRLKGEVEKNPELQQSIKELKEKTGDLQSRSIGRRRISSLSTLSHVQHHGSISMFNDASKELLCFSSSAVGRTHMPIALEQSQGISQFTMLRMISTMRSMSLDSKEKPVPSPLTMVPVAGDAGGKKVVSKEAEKRPVQAVLKKIKESPKKVNLVAALVRGMRVEDALMQLAVLQKRAAKTVKRVVANARANATQNHGLDGDRLYVAEAFVGKGKYLRRLSFHAKGRSGIMHHPSCRLTVVVKEMSAEQEALIAKYQTMTFRERATVRTKLLPHKFIESSPQWHRRPKDQAPSMEA